MHPETCQHLVSKGVTTGNSTATVRLCAHAIQFHAQLLISTETRVLYCLDSQRRKLQLHRLCCESARYPEPGAHTSTRYCQTDNSLRAGQQHHREHQSQSTEDKNV
jgi:hypothetical protein